MKKGWRILVIIFWGLLGVVTLVVDFFFGIIQFFQDPDKPSKIRDLDNKITKWYLTRLSEAKTA